MKINFKKRRLIKMESQKKEVTVTMDCQVTIVFKGDDANLAYDFIEGVGKKKFENIFRNGFKAAVGADDLNIKNLKYFVIDK